MQFSGLAVRGGDLSGPTGRYCYFSLLIADLDELAVWSMPGGFTSGGRDGYQTVDEERPIENTRPVAPPGPATNVPPVAGQHAVGPGAYQTV